MPMKMKMKAQRSKKQKGDSNFDPPRTFVDEHCEAKWREWSTSNKKIIMEVALLATANDGHVMHQIVARKWQRLCNPEVNGNVNVVLEFYANAKYHSSNDVVLVRGKEISFSQAAIREIFNLPTMENDAYYPMLNDGPNYDQILRELGPPGAQWTYSTSNPEKPISCSINVLNRWAKAWLHFLLGNLQPSSQHTEINMDRIVLLYCICKGLPIDISAVIYNSIRHIINGTTSAALGFASLITNLCAKAKVAMHDSEPQLIVSIINSARINRWEEWYVNHGHPSGLGWSVDPNDPNIPPPPKPLASKVRAAFREGIRDLNNPESTAIRTRGGIRSMERTSGAQPSSSTAAPPPTTSHEMSGSFNMESMRQYFDTQFSSIHRHIATLENRQMVLGQHVQYIEAHYHESQPQFLPQQYPDDFWQPFVYDQPSQPSQDPPPPSEHTHMEEDDPWAPHFRR